MPSTDTLSLLSDPVIAERFTEVFAEARADSPRRSPFWMARGDDSYELNVEKIAKRAAYLVCLDREAVTGVNAQAALDRLMGVAAQAVAA